MIPTLDEITESEINIDNIKPIKIEDLLVKTVPPDRKLLEEGVFQSLFVSQVLGDLLEVICNQLIKYKPKKIILIEQSEIALYNIYENLKARKQIFK